MNDGRGAPAGKADSKRGYLWDASLGDWAFDPDPELRTLVIYQETAGTVHTVGQLRLHREGDAAWPADLLALRDRVAWRDTQQDTLRQDIQDGHCGAMPEAMLPGMVQAQRARDAAMAQAMFDARKSGARRVVLIAGNGHVRRDVAVPVYLQAAGVPASDIDAVAYLEPGGATPAGGYDRIERAPAPTREDPCAPFKR